MTDKADGNKEPRSESAGDDPGAGGALALNTVMKKTSATIIAFIGGLAALAVFTGPFAKSGSELILITLAALAAIMLVGAGFAALYTYRKKRITASVTTMALISIFVLAIGAGVGYLVWHSRSSLETPTSTPPTGAQISPTPAGSVEGYTAQVAWTDDGGGGGSLSTTLYAFTTPYSHIHDGAYPLNESLTVVCKIQNGRGIQVGPTYKGPDPHSRVWYELDNGAWVPAVYTYVDKPNIVPSCS
jgi:flagellar basal body-associated protein FliL